MSLSSIPTRANGQTIMASWFNTIRTELLSMFGSASISLTEFTIVNNQSSAANVTGLSFSGASVRAAVVEYAIYRLTTGGGAVELSECGQLFLTYSGSAASWELADGPKVGDAGVDFSVTAAGQVQYTSTSITGSASVSKMTFSARTIPV